MGEPPSQYRSPASRPATAAAFCFFCGRPGTAGGACSVCNVSIADPERDVPVELGCPRCGAALEAHAVDGGVSVHACGACGGLFVDGRAWSTLVLRPELAADLARRLPPRPPPAAFTPLLPCSSCGREMERGQFAVSSGIPIDVCPEHGMWLDAGELEEVVRHPALTGESADDAAPKPPAGPLPPGFSSTEAYIEELNRVANRSLVNAEAMIALQRRTHQNAFVISQSDIPQHLRSRPVHTLRRPVAIAAGGAVLFFILTSIPLKCTRRAPAHLPSEESAMREGVRERPPATPARRPAPPLTPARPPR